MKNTTISFKTPWIIGLLSAISIVGLIAWATRQVEPHKPGKPSSIRTSSNQTLDKATQQLKSLTPAELDATANAKPCDFTVLTHLDLSRPPSEAELIAAGNLGKKLTPTRSADPGSMAAPASAKKQEFDNFAFGIAIQAWNEHRYPERGRVAHFNNFDERVPSRLGSPPR